MSEYIAVNKEAAEEFESKMSRNILYRSTDNFIALYNSNLINKSNSEIDKVAKGITEVYKNVTLNNRKFIVKSKEEVVSDEFEVLFPHVSFVATLKRIASDILKDNYPEDTMIVFTEENQNAVQLYDVTAEELIIYEGAERLRNVNESIASNPFIVNNVNLQPYGEDGEGISFKAIEILELDTSFISDIGDLLESYLN